MSDSNLHQKKKAKNYALMAVLLVFVVILFCIGMIKMAGKLVI